MKNNPYLQKLESQWKQLKASWQQEKAKLENENANAEIEKSLQELQTQFDAAGKLTEAKLKEWGAQAEQEMQKLRLKFNNPSDVVQEIKKSVSTTTEDNKQTS